jgi:hypothetical protein
MTRFWRYPLAMTNRVRLAIGITVVAIVLALLIPVILLSPNAGLTLPR